MKIKRLFTILMLASGLSAMALPCFNIWQRCLNAGGSSQVCDDVWDACMEELYGVE